jgi:hypothetical protein
MAFVHTRRALLTLALSLAFIPAALGQGKTSESVVKATAKDGTARDGKRVLVVELDIAKGWHLYGNPAGNEDLDSVKTTVSVTGEKAEVVYPKAKMVIDPVVGNYNTYEGKQKIEVLLPAGKTGPVKLQVSFQACDEKTCLQPAKVTLEVK